MENHSNWMVEWKRNHEYIE